MKREELIRQLEELPEGTEIAVLDWRKNLSEDSGDGSSSGVYYNIEIELHRESANQLATINFDNTDYTDEGILVDGPADEDIKRKAEKWDKLGRQIAKCYPTDEREETEIPGADLSTIGEIAASAFGWL